MKTIAVLELDLEVTPLGTRSRAAECLAGMPVVRRTVERLARCTRLAGIHVLAPAEQVAAARDLLFGFPVQVHARQEGQHGKAGAWVRLARKWSLDSWRGGIGSAAAMDEYLTPGAAAAVARAESAEAVLSVSPAAALIDPILADAMIAHAEAIGEDIRLTFTVAPPGLAGTILQASLLEELQKHDLPPSWTLTYQPDAPTPDLMFKPCCFHAAEPVRHSAGRLIADTRRSFERVAACLAAGADASADSAGRWLIAQEAEHVPPLPREVEIELTTEDQLASTLLRPRGGLVGKRGPMPLDAINRIGTELAAYDDSLVLVGGFGEPLLHPAWPEALRILREAGVFGIALRTNALALDAAAVKALLDSPVDIVEVTLDAATAQTYAQVNGADSLNAATENVLRLEKARRDRRQEVPLIVPRIVKCHETADELDAFYDSWIRKVGAASIAGYNSYGGRLPDRALLDMSPPLRTPCRRIMSRCMIAADGQVLLCDQDYACERPVGTLSEAGLAELWNGAAFSAARQAHAEGRHDHVPLCSTCQEWHRP